MRTISAEEASRNLLKWLDRIEAGEEIVITRDGRPVATLRPYGEVAKKDAGPLEMTPEELVERDVGGVVGYPPSVAFLRRPHVHELDVVGRLESRRIDFARHDWIVDSGVLRGASGPAF